MRVGFLFLIILGSCFQLQASFTDTIELSAAPTEKLGLFENFLERKQVFVYLCEKCEMPPQNVMSDLVDESKLLNVNKKSALEDIMQIFHLNVTAPVSYLVIEKLSRQFEKEWMKLSSIKNLK